MGKPDAAGRCGIQPISRSAIVSPKTRAHETAPKATKIKPLIAANISIKRLVVLFTYEVIYCSLNESKKFFLFIVSRFCQNHAWRKAAVLPSSALTVATNEIKRGILTESQNGSLSRQTSQPASISDCAITLLCTIPWICRLQRHCAVAKNRSLLNIDMVWAQLTGISLPSRAGKRRAAGYVARQIGRRVFNALSPVSKSGEHTGSRYSAYSFSTRSPGRCRGRQNCRVDIVVSAGISPAVYQPDSDIDSDKLD